jgi:hypothetical protein
VAKKLRRTSSAPGPDSTPSERVNWLLDHVWSGNRSAMARDVGVTHSVLGKIATGQQNAGRRLLGAIASHPKVSPAWLLAGQGEPLLAASPDTPTAGWPVPIFRQLLTGTPDQNRDLWSGESFPLAGSLFRPTRYWMEVVPSEPVVNHPFMHIRPYDLLLMETDPVWWKTEDMVDQRICAIKLPGSAAAKLGQVNWFPISEDEPASLRAEMFDKQIDRSKIVRKTEILEGPNGETRVITVPMVRTGGSLKKINRLQLAPITDEVGLQHIMSACQLLLRR